MKRAFAAAAAVFAVLLCFVGCSDVINKIPGGYIGKEEFFDKEGFQDHTDYCRYTYKDGSKIEKDPSYRMITEDEVDAAAGYFENFRALMLDQGRADEFDFDLSVITAGDYVYIDTKEGSPIGRSFYGKYDDYSVYLFDVQTCVLYYVHNNI